VSLLYHLQLICVVSLGPILAAKHYRFVYYPSLSDKLRQLEKNRIDSSEEVNEMGSIYSQLLGPLGSRPEPE
jgi:hypothetical protein